jgi:hypothetical protein
MIERIGIMREPELSLLFRSGRPPAFTLRQSPPQKRINLLGRQFLQVEVLPNDFSERIQVQASVGTKRGWQYLVAYTARFSSSTHRRVYVLRANDTPRSTVIMSHQ